MFFMLQNEGLNMTFFFLVTLDNVSIYFPFSHRRVSLEDKMLLVDPKERGWNHHRTDLGVPTTKF